MHIGLLTLADLPAATDCMVAAFSEDPLAGAFFDDSPQGRTRSSASFFALLLEVRLALKMPALVAKVDGVLAGVAMGYDTAREEWPADLKQRWQDFEASHPGLAARFESYDSIAMAAQPDMPHYYLGVLSVSPAFQGRGIGKALVRAFLDLSDRDSRSQGTSLETATPSNLGFYRGLGFHTRFSGPLGAVQLWCLFRPNPAAVSP